MWLKWRQTKKRLQKKLDLVLQFEKKVDFLLQILNKKEQWKNDNDFETSASNEFLNPLAYQFPVECTPPQSNDGSLMMFELSPGCHELPPSEVEPIQFKRRMIGNVRYKEFPNPSGKQFKVNDPCEVDPLRPYDKDQFKSLINGWRAL